MSGSATDKPKWLFTVLHLTLGQGILKNILYDRDLSTVLQLTLGQDILQDILYSLPWAEPPEQ